MAAISTSLPVQYSSAISPGQTKLVWGFGTGFFSGTGIPIRLYVLISGGTGGTSPGSLQVTARNGTLAEAGADIELVEQEGVTFQGSDRASLKYPALSLASATIIGTASALADGGGWREVSPVLSVDSATGEVVASEAFYGRAVVSYSAPYRKYLFTRTTGAKLTGEALASYRGAVATLEIPLGEDETTDVWLVAKVVSKALAVSRAGAPDDQAGLWEIPPGWYTADGGIDENGAGWGGSIGDIDPDYAALVERTHAVVYQNALGQVRYSFNNDLKRSGWGKPKSGDTNFNPRYRLVFTDDLPDGIGVDQDAIRARFEPYFRGLK